MAVDDIPAIRAASAADLDAVSTCAERAYAIYVERSGRKPAPMIADFAASLEARSLFVAEASGELYGFVVFYPRGDHMHLENVAVDPAYQGRGIGARLIAFVETRAKRLGLGCVELYTNARMSENLELYPRLGYAAFDRCVEDGFDRVYFRKTLAAGEGREPG